MNCVVRAVIPVYQPMSSKAGSYESSLKLRWRHLQQKMSRVQPENLELGPEVEEAGQGGLEENSHGWAPLRC